jgi:hypothetical protein
MQIFPFILLLSILPLTACTTIGEPPLSPASFRPADGMRTKPEQASVDAATISYQTCKGRSLQAGAGVAIPSAVPPVSQVNVSATASVRSASPQYFTGFQSDTSSDLAAYQAGAAMRAKGDLENATFLACMGQDGWLLKQPRSR